MNASKLKKIIEEAVDKKSESSDIEFKDARSGIPSNLWKAISAFSNSPNGGIIVFGIQETPAPDREIKIVGGLDVQTLQEKIVQLMEQSIQNKAGYTLSVVNVRGHELLTLEISETEKENKPCFYKKLGMDKGSYIRIGNSNQSISEAELRSFLRYSPAYNYDKTVFNSLSVDYLDHNKLQSFLDASAKKRNRKYSTDVDISVTLANIGLLQKSESNFHPTLAGAMIFAKTNPQEAEPFSRYIVRCVNYAGKTHSSKIVDKKDIDGTLDEQVDASLAFILRSIRTEAKIVKSKRIEKYEYPELALREIVVNALIHRDYSNTGTYVQIAVFKDRIEVSNPGTLPPGVTVSNIQAAQFSRNGIISKVMRDMDYMEEFGRGIDLIYSEMNRWGLVEPLFKNSSNSFKVILLGSDYLKLNYRQLKFWNVLQDSNYLTASIAKDLFSDLSRPTINTDLKEMVDLGLIRMKGASSNTHYESEY
jgi:ATP-dependent DNA helicase RecG